MYGEHTMKIKVIGNKLHTSKGKKVKGEIVDLPRPEVDRLSKIQGLAFKVLPAEKGKAK
jgi:hypothetical protein